MFHLKLLVQMVQNCQLISIVAQVQIYIIQKSSQYLLYRAVGKYYTRLPKYCTEDCQYIFYGADENITYIELLV